VPESPKQSLFASLRYPGTKIYFSGLTISMVGGWMQWIALAWLVTNNLGGKGAQLSWQQASQFLPMAIFGSWAGSIADRIDKRRLMVITQVVLAVMALALAWFDFAGKATMPIVLIVSFITGTASAFDTPVRRSLIGDLVPQEALPNAMSLNTGVMTSSRAIGMALGGFVVYHAGTSWCFLINGLSYLAMLASLGSLKHRDHRSSPAKQGDGVLGALRHIWLTPALRVTMLVTAVTATLTFNYALTLPLMIKSVFHLRSDSLGLLMMFTSIGSFAGALSSARLAKPSVNIFLLGNAIMGVATVLVSLSTSFVWCLVACIPMGYGGGLLMAQMSGLLTTLSPSSMRGRVLGFQSVVFIGSTPFGSPLIGWVADHVSIRDATALGGYGALIGVALSIALGQVRRRPALS
jgi:MFS family permease